VLAINQPVSFFPSILNGVFYPAAKEFELHLDSEFLAGTIEQSEIQASLKTVLADAPSGPRQIGEVPAGILNYTGRIAIMRMFSSEY
jgi:hypothetical protein